MKVDSTKLRKAISDVVYRKEQYDEALRKLTDAENVQTEALKEVAQLLNTEEKRNRIRLPVDGIIRLDYATLLMSKYNEETNEYVFDVLPIIDIEDIDNPSYVETSPRTIELELPF